MKKNMSGIVMSFVASMVLSIVIGSLTPAFAESEMKKSLYDRLGGIYPISVVVDGFFELLLLNDTVNANPAVKSARNRVPIAGLKFHVTAMMCQETGGPCKYTGRTMKDSHAHLNISEKEWEAMLSDFRRVLNNFSVPTMEQQELIKIVESTKKDIVVPGMK